MTMIRLEMETDVKITPDYISPKEVYIPSSLALKNLSFRDGKYIYEVFSLMDSPINKTIEAYIHEFLTQVNSHKGLFEADEENVYDIMEDLVDLMKDTSCFETNFFRLYGVKLGVFVSKCAWALEFGDSHECKFYIQLLHE